MIEIIQPKDQEHWLNLRMQDLTSTDIAALFGISPYLTLFELWHRKKNAVNVEFNVNERMKWGTLLQDSIAKGVAEEQGWAVRRMDEYVRNPELRLGSSFDFSIDGGVLKMFDGPDGMLVSKERLGLLEVKNVDGLQFKNEWRENEDGSFEAPYHIEIQVQHQLLVSERSFGYIAALVGGNRLILIKRLPDESIHTAIKEKAAEFWKSIEENNPPSPNFDTDASFIAKLYNYSEPGTVIDVSDDEDINKLVVEYKALKDIIKVNDSRCDAIKAELLVRIGTAEKCISPLFSISAGTVGPSWVEAFERKGYRNFRVNWKKGKV